MDSSDSESSDDEFAPGEPQNTKKRKHHHKRKHRKKSKEREHKRRRSSSGTGTTSGRTGTTSGLRSPQSSGSTSTGQNQPEKKKDFRSRLKEGTWRKIMQGIAKAGKMHDPKLDSLISRVKELKEHRVQEKLEKGKRHATEEDVVFRSDTASGGGSSSSLNMGSVLHGSQVPANEKESKREEAIPSEDVKEEVKAGNKATPNLSAWFKAFGAPKKGNTPVAKVKPTTPVVAKQVAPWAYSKMENEQLQRRKSTEENTGVIPSKPLPPDSKLSLPSPSGVRAAALGQERSPAYHPSPGRGEVHSPMYLSSESDRSPQTPGYTQGSSWSTQPSPIPEQRSPATPSGSGSNGNNFMSKMPPPKVGFYQEAGPKTPVSPAVAPISPSVQSPLSVGASSVTSPANPIPVNSPKHENLAALSQSALSSKGYDHYSPQYNPVSPKTSPYGPPTPSTNGGVTAPTSSPASSSKTPVAVASSTTTSPQTAGGTNTVSPFPNYYQSLSRQSGSVSISLAPAQQQKEKPLPATMIPKTTSSIMTKSSTVVTPLPTPPFSVPSSGTGSNDPASLLASLSQLVSSRLSPIQPSSGVASSTSSVSITPAPSTKSNAKQTSTTQAAAVSSNTGMAASQYYPQYPQYPGPFAGQWPAFPTGTAASTAKTAPQQGQYSQHLQESNSAVQQNAAAASQKPSSQHQTAASYQQQRFSFQQQQTYGAPMTFPSTNNLTAKASSTKQTAAYQTSSSYDSSYTAFGFHPGGSATGSFSQPAASSKRTSSKSGGTSHGANMNPTFPSQTNASAAVTQKATPYSSMMSAAGAVSSGGSSSSPSGSSTPFSTGPYSNLQPGGAGLTDPHALASRHSPYISSALSGSASASSRSKTSSSASPAATPGTSSSGTSSSTSTTGYTSQPYPDYTNQYNPFAAFGGSGLRQPFPFMDPTIYQQYMQRQQEDMFLRNPLMQQQIMQQQASMGYNPMLAQLRGVIRPGWP